MKFRALNENILFINITYTIYKSIFHPKICTFQNYSTNWGFKYFSFLSITLKEKDSLILNHSKKQF